jgi:hypothetical protein
MMFYTGASILLFFMEALHEGAGMLGHPSREETLLFCMPLGGSESAGSFNSIDYEFVAR